MIPLIPRITSLEAAMMGRQTSDQASLFYEFRLDDRIPKGHLLRRINIVVGPDLDGMRGQLEPYYSEIGRLGMDGQSQQASSIRLWPQLPGGHRECGDCRR